MRIAQIAPPFLTVPPSDYGGIELVVALLADGLVARGHDVTLFASPGSRTAARLEPVLDRAPAPEALADEAYALTHALRAYEALDGFDVIHDHTLQGPALAARQDGRSPVVHTLHGPWTEAARKYYGGLQHSVHLVAISESQKAANPDIRYAGVVPNGIDLPAYPLREDKEDLLVFIGRCIPDQGPELAVQVAQRAGLPLAMVVKRAEPVEQRHWDEVVAPLLDGSEEIIDAVGHDDKVELLGRARALLMPIQWDEPFGLVMTEAMACGTPVVARPLGAARDLVADGVSGYLRDSVEDMAAAVGEVGKLSPRRCREHVAASFSAEVMVSGYEEVFGRVVAAAPAGRSRS